MIFVFEFQIFERIQRFGAGEGIRTLDPNLGKKTDWLFLSTPDLDKVRKSSDIVQLIFS